VLWIVSGALFLGSSEICSNLSVTHEMLLCVDRMRYIWSGTIRELSMGCVWHWSGFPMQGVHRFESPRLSNMSNRLSRGSLHVENLMAWIMAYNGIVMHNYLIATLT
jgi:hypothetical protein